MLIGICGGICAGKSSIASFLVKEHGFTQLHLERSASTPAVEKSASNTTVPHEQTSVNNGRLPFQNAEALLDHVTARWKEHWVTTDVWDETVLDVLLRRPFFLLVSVDAPVTLRWERFNARCLASDLTPPSLAEFVTRNDAHLYGPEQPLAPLLHRAQLRLLNSATSIKAFHTALHQLDLPHEGRIRPVWDQYFMQLASLAAHRSNCMKRSVGCVLVREKRVISTGYNGTPRGMKNCNDGGCKRCNASMRSGVGLDTCLCLHAEENALLEAGRDRVGEGATLYCNTCPCLTCSVKIAQIGISEVVYSNAYSLDTAAQAIFEESGVKLRQFYPPKEGLIDLDPTRNMPLREPQANGGSGSG